MPALKLKRTSRQNPFRPDAKNGRVVAVTFTGFERGKAIWIDPFRLKHYNSKLYGIYTFDLPCVISCPYNKACKNNCYARKAERLFPDVYNHRLINYMLAGKTDILEEYIPLQIERCGIKTIRLHASGDFFSNSYVETWEGIIEQYPETLFYTYSKNHVAIDRLERLPNMNIIDSRIPFDGVNFLPVSDPRIFSALQNGWIVCPATIQTGLKCGKDCLYCVNKGNSKVVFARH
jgi:hypothetical protein